MFGIYLDPASGMSKTAQLCRQIRQKIERGELQKGMRLPPTRKLAQELNIARNVVLDAYEQLIAEGYLVGQTGSGTYVAGGIAVMAPLGAAAGEPQGMDGPEGEERRNDERDIIDFAAGTPDLRSFPRARWASYLKAAAETVPDAQLDYGDSLGEAALRREISAYLYRTRGMRCHPGQILITSGSSEGFSLIAHAMRRGYHSVYLEDPTVEFTRHIFRRHDYRLLPVGVDDRGMKLHELGAVENGHLLLVTPSHQFPTGSILAIQRRQLAVRLAERSDAYLIEDDYDGDFRLKGVPIPPLQALNPERVIYVGTFSKTLAPGLRIGFLVLPPRLISRFTQIREEMNFRVPAVLQLALAKFMEEGRLDRHIHKMKAVYRQRRNLLVAALKRHFGDSVSIGGDEAGMHIRVDFSPELAGIKWQRSAEYGVRVHAVEEDCLIKGRHHHQIVLGYGNLAGDQIETGIARLRHFVQDS